MSTSKEFLTYTLDALSHLSEISTRAMIGEYVLYFRGKVVGGICDNRLLVKPTPSALRCTPHPTLELPYPGAKEMLLVTETDDRDYLTSLFDGLYRDLPEPKPKRKQ